MQSFSPELFLADEVTPDQGSPMELVSPAPTPAAAAAAAAAVQQQQPAEAAAVAAGAAVDGGLLLASPPGSAEQQAAALEAAAARDAELTALIQAALARPPGKRRGRPPQRQAPADDAAILEQLLQVGAEAPSLSFFFLSSSFFWGGGSAPRLLPLLAWTLAPRLRRPTQDPARRALPLEELKLALRREKNRLAAGASRAARDGYTAALERQVGGTAGGGARPRGRVHMGGLGGVPLAGRRSTLWPCLTRTHARTHIRTHAHTCAFARAHVQRACAPLTHNRH